MKQKKSITLFTSGFSGGGAERVAAYILKHWIEDGRDVQIITKQNYESDIYFDGRDKGVKRYIIGRAGASKTKIGALVSFGTLIMRLRSAIKESNSDVYVSFLTKNNIMLIIASLGLRKRVIISERNDTATQDHSWPWNNLREKLYHYSDIVTANSQIAIDDMNDYVDPAKLVLIHNPVYIPPEKTSHTIQKHKILHVGRLEKVKNQEFLIEVFSDLSKKERGDWQLEILGEGSDREALEQLIKDQNSEQIIQLKGFVRDISQEYLQSSIFVLCSNYEGTPNALLEAMSYGLAVLVSDGLPGAVSLIKHSENGFLYRADDEEELKKYLLLLMNDAPLRKKIGLAARETVQQFDPKLIMKQWDHIVDEDKPDKNY